MTGPQCPPKLSYCYPAELLGIEMIDLVRDVPFHLALKHEARICALRL